MPSNEPKPSRFEAAQSPLEPGRRTQPRLQLGAADSRWRALGLSVLGVLVVLAAWHLGTSLSTGIVRVFAPADAFATLWELLHRPRLYQHIQASLYRVGVSLLLCIAIGIPVGIVVGVSRAVQQSTAVIFQFLRMISPLAWFPVAVMVLGVGSPAAIFVMTMAGIWPIILSTAHGVATMNPTWLKVGRSLGAGPERLLTRIILPGVLPDMLHGIRLSIGIIWIILVPAEMLGVSSGLGYAILDARDRFAYAEIPAIIMVIGFIGYWLDLAVRRLESWRRPDQRAA